MRINGLGEVKVTPIGSVRPAADNPRKINDADIDIVAKSLKRFGWQQPIVIDRDGVIIAGHTRHLAAKKLGLSHVPAVVADLSPSEAKAYRIADNRTSDFSTWDFPELVIQLEELSADFSEELYLADWAAIEAEFEELLETGVGESEPSAPAASSGQGEQSAEYGAESETDTEGGGEETSPSTNVPPLDVPKDLEEHLSTGKQLVVVCADDTVAANVQEILLGVEGVHDVRYKR